MDANKKKAGDAERSPERSRSSGAEARVKLIRSMELAWVAKEEEATIANARTVKPRGLLGRIGLNTATG